MSETLPAGVPVCYRHAGREAHIRCQRCDRPICPDCMRDASVGFQCPDCVREGRGTVRQARTPFGGRISAGAPVVTIVIGALNALVWALITATGGATSRLVDLLALMPAGRCDLPDGRSVVGVSGQMCSANGATWVPGVDDGAVWQLLTAAFTHVEPMHIGFNMLSLAMLGPQLERLLGRGRYLALYLLSALAGSSLVYWTTVPYVSTLGASGAVFGLMAAILFIVLRTRQSAQSLLLWVGLSFAYSFFAPGISWQGHLGGFIGGLAVMAVLAWAPRSRRTPAQVGGLAVLLVLLVAAVLLRTLQLR